MSNAMQLNIESASDVRQDAHVWTCIIGLALLNLLGVFVMNSLGGWAFLPALLWFLIVPVVLAKQQTAHRFGKCVFALYGRFFLWGIASLLLFMIGGALLMMVAEYLDAWLNRGP